MQIKSNLGVRIESRVSKFLSHIGQRYLRRQFMGLAGRLSSNPPKTKSKGVA